MADLRHEDARAAEIERSQRADVLEDKFKLEDKTLQNIERNLNRLRALSYFDARAVLDAYRVMKANRDSLLLEINRLKTEAQSLELQNAELREASKPGLVSRVLRRMKVKRLAILALVLITATLPLFGQGLTDASAMFRARALFGAIVRITQIRGPSDTYWTKHIGFDSTGCKMPFTSIGSGLNTWDAAFAAIPPNAVKGPYSGTITLKATAFDNVAIAGMQFRIDGIELGAELQPTFIAQQYDGMMQWNTAAVTNGVHSLCVTARDGENNTGRSDAILIRVTQSVASIGNEIVLSGPMSPSISEPNNQPVQIGD